MTELKPCPFCGGEVKISGVLIDGSCFVSCKNCGASTYNTKDMRVYFKDAKDAIEAWNTRAADNATQHTHCCPCGAERTCNIESCEEFDERGIWAIELSCGHADIYSSMKPGHCSCCGAKVVE